METHEQSWKLWKSIKKNKNKNNLWFLNKKKPRRAQKAYQMSTENSMKFPFELKKTENAIFCWKIVQAMRPKLNFSQLQ